MANQIIDPGFENNDPLWQLSDGESSSGSADRREPSARSGSWGSRLVSEAGTTQPEPLGPIIAQVITLPNLDDCRLKFWAQQTGTPSSVRDLFKMQVWIFPGTITPSLWRSEIGSVWEQLDSGLFTPTNTTLTLINDAAFQYPGSGAIPASPARWEMDDWTLTQTDTTTIPKGMYNGRVALKAALQSINGSTGGYYNDLSSLRVFDKLILPDERSDMPAVYLCMPLADEIERFEEQEQHGVRCFWSQTIFGFAQDTSSDPMSTDLVDIIAKLRDDLVRYFQKTPRLGGTVVRNVKLTTDQLVAGMLGEDDYGELQLTIEVEQLIGWADLGPDA
jgi:hypothetical protein